VTPLKFHTLSSPRGLPGKPVSRSVVSSCHEVTGLVSRGIPPGIPRGVPHGVPREFRTRRVRFPQVPREFLVARASHGHVITQGGHEFHVTT